MHVSLSVFIYPKKCEGNQVNNYRFYIYWERLHTVLNIKVLLTMQEKGILSKTPGKMSGKQSGNLVKKILASQNNTTNPFKL